MHILVDSGTYDCRNMGDVAMLQVAVQRLRALWPAATIRVFTADPAELVRHCPDALPADHHAREFWFSGSIPLGRLRKVMPSSVRRTLDRAVSTMRNSFPGVYRSGLLAWKQFRGADDGSVDDFLTTVRGTDLFVACGQGTLTDAGKTQSVHLLETALLAARAGAQIVFFGQGIGPMTDPDLLRTSRRILGRAGLITLRERLLGPRILTELGIPKARWMETGDEAIELAYRMSPTEIGGAIGVHVRRAPLAPVEAAAFKTIGRVLHGWATEHGAELLPIPISQHDRGTNDARTIAELLREQGVESDGGRALDTPAAVIAQVARCRLVVTGAYHAAVFALSQGIPVICLGGSEYYLIKFSGLIDLFPSGCQVVRFDDAELSAHLTEAIDRAWRCTDSARADLQLAAVQQIEWGREAYERVRSLVEKVPVSRHVPAGVGANTAA